MSSSIHDGPAGLDVAVPPTDAAANVTPATDVTPPSDAAANVTPGTGADADRTRVPADGPCGRVQVSRRRWWR